MKITYFSDTHAHHRQVTIPKSDTVIFGGDLMTDGYTFYEVIDFLDWFNGIDAEHKIMIAGNHDRLFENAPSITRSTLSEYPNIIYLENSEVIVEGIKIYGSPNSHFFCNWAFNNSKDELKRIFSFIPDDVDILVTHAPQYGVADGLEAPHGHIGEPELSEQMGRLHKLKYHLVGHVHVKYGVYFTSPFHTINGCVVDAHYKVKNKPITFYLP